MPSTAADPIVREHERRVIAAYASEARRDFNPTERSQYLNIGYWRDEPRTLDEAAEAMVRLVAQTAGLSERDAVLDVGCGYGDAAMFWAAEFGPRHITGLDINPAEIEAGRRRLADRGLTDRVDLKVGSAVELPFADESFDTVVAVEAAHHFLTRERFFHESRRVLRPGGRLVLADVVPLPGKRFQPFFNPQNMYPADEYARKLSGAGFSQVSISSIRDHVFKPYSNFIRSRLPRGHVKGWINVALHRLVSARLDYILASATKA